MQALSFSVSARGKDPQTTMRSFFRSKFPGLDLTTVDMVFGFVEPSPLYGGRIYNRPELTDNDIAYLSAHKIGLKLPFSNHFVSEEEYESSRPLLEKYHKEGNAVVVVNDDLARWIRRDFPKYEIEASVIKHINKQWQINNALELYDTIVLPMDLCLKPEYLEKLQPKERIRLFCNAGCAVSCPSRICYAGISKDNKYTPETRPHLAQCSKDSVAPRDDTEFMDFDIEMLHNLGFTKFKMLRSKGAGGGTGY